MSKQAETLSRNPSPSTAGRKPPTLSSPWEAKASDHISSTPTKVATWGTGPQVLQFWKSMRLELKSPTGQTKQWLLMGLWISTKVISPQASAQREQAKMSISISQSVPGRGSMAYFTSGCRKDPTLIRVPLGADYSLCRALKDQWALVPHSPSRFFQQ